MKVEFGEARDAGQGTCFDVIIDGSKAGVVGYLTRGRPWEVQQSVADRIPGVPRKFRSRLQLDSVQAEIRRIAAEAA